jgi:hypothetical protein
MPRWPADYQRKSNCPQCGVRKNRAAKLCRACTVPNKSLLGRTGEAHPAWRGGQREDADGYLRTYAPDHPWPRRGGYVYEHVRVMELHLGRRLGPDEVVHHIDHDRKNNGLSNLVVLERGEHSSHHRELDHVFRDRDSLGRFA